MIGWHPFQLSGPAQSDWLSVVFVQHCGKQEGDGAPSRHLRDSDYSAQPPPPANFYPQLTSRRLPPECVPSSSHLLCFSTLTYCLEAGDARHSGQAWALCLRSSRRYLVDHATVEIFERQNDLAEILLCYQLIFRHFRLALDAKTLETNSNNIWEQYSGSER